MYAESSTLLFSFITRRRGGEGVSEKYCAITPYLLILQTHHPHTQCTHRILNARTTPTHLLSLSAPELVPWSKSPISAPPLRQVAVSVSFRSRGWRSLPFFFSLFSSLIAFAEPPPPCASSGDLTDAVCMSSVSLSKGRTCVCVCV
jgi:hypothetical protein